MSGYRVVWSEVAEAERDAAFLQHNRFDPHYAGEWLRILVRKTYEIADWPGPLGNARDEEACDLYGYEVRRVQYRGPSGRDTGYRILYRVTQPTADEPGIITIMRVVHGSRPLVLPTDNDD